MAFYPNHVTTEEEINMFERLKERIFRLLWGDPWEDFKKSLPSREEVKRRCEDLGPVLEQLKKERNEKHSDGK